MAQGKRISADIDGAALQAAKAMGAAAKRCRLAAGEGQAAAAARLGVHVQTIGRIESGEPGVAWPIWEWKSASQVDHTNSTTVVAPTTYLPTGCVQKFPTPRVNATMPWGRKCSCSLGAGR